MNLEYVFKWLVNNSTLILGVITVSFSILKWSKTHKAKIKQQRYENYIDLINTVTSEGRIINQIATVWLLKEYNEYIDITHRILDQEKILKISAGEAWKTYVLPEIKLMLEYNNVN